MSDLAKKYQAIKKIVDDRQHGKVDGVGVDVFTAGMLLQICDKLNPMNRAKFLSMPIDKMVDAGWNLSKAAWKNSVPRYEREIRGSMKIAGRMKEIAMLKDDLARLSDEFDYLLENDPDNKGLKDMQDQIEEMRSKLHAVMPSLKVGEAPMLLSDYKTLLKGKESAIDATATEALRKDWRIGATGALNRALSENGFAHPKFMCKNEKTADAVLWYCDRKSKQ